jgi:hypothetical protein
MLANKVHAHKVYAHEVVYADEMYVDEVYAHTSSYLSLSPPVLAERTPYYMFFGALIHSTNQKTTIEAVIESQRPSVGYLCRNYNICVVMENGQYREALFYLTTLSSRPQQSLVGCYTPKPKSPDLLARHRTLPTNFRLPASYPSHELPSISLRQPARWADVSSTRSVERVDPHSHALRLDLLIFASMHPELAGMLELLCVEVLHVYRNQ